MTSKKIQFHIKHLVKQINLRTKLLKSMCLGDTAMYLLRSRVYSTQKGHCHVFLLIIFWHAGYIQHREEQCHIFFEIESIFNTKNICDTAPDCYVFDCPKQQLSSQCRYRHIFGFSPLVHLLLGNREESRVGFFQGNTVVLPPLNYSNMEHQNGCSEKPMVEVQTVRHFQGCNLHSTLTIPLSHP